MRLNRISACNVSWLRHGEVVGSQLVRFLRGDRYWSYSPFLVLGRAFAFTLQTGPRNNSRARSSFRYRSLLPSAKGRYAAFPSTVAVTTDGDHVVTIVDGIDSEMLGPAREDERHPFLRWNEGRLATRAAIRPSMRPLAIPSLRPLPRKI